MRANLPPFNDVDKDKLKDSDEFHYRHFNDFDEQRADAIGQNSNEGDHYTVLYPPQNEFKKIPEEVDLKASDRQVGGTHYKTLGIQPLEHTYITYGYIGLKAAVHTKVDKYLKRNKDNEVQDIKKAIHCLEILLEKAEEEGK